MTQELKERIEQAIHEVYERTTGRYGSEYTAEVTVIHKGFLDYRKSTIRITRTFKKDDLTYKLYTPHDDRPLITAYGCWPFEFVSDIFTRAVEHFYNLYEIQ